MKKIGEWLLLQFDQLLDAFNITEETQNILQVIILVTIVLAASYLVDLIAKYLLKTVLFRLVKKSKTQWDDYLMKRNFFKRLAHFAPALVIYFSIESALASYPELANFLHSIVYAYMIILSMLILESIINSFHDFYILLPVSKERPLKGYIQTAKIILYFITGILVLSVILEKNPGYFLTGLGALTAVLLLVFKDPILGFVASIQLSANNMVKIGDWIEMPKFGADGDVIEISLTTVKVQNFDKTIITIPPYALVSESFRNWRGMQESGGRRIKRSLLVDMNTIHFCTDEMIERFRQIRYISQYIDQKKAEVNKYNEEQAVQKEDMVNRRRLTNIGTFRAYVIQYLKHHPKIRQDMTFLVRQLAPTDRGLPIEIYVFTNDIIWVNYENIQADIFDHLLSVVPEFDLRLFQNPTGSDFRYLKTGEKL